MSGVATGLRAGAARVDLTPSQPTPMAGYPVIHLFDDGPRDHVGYTGRTGLSSGCHDPLYARALVIDDGRQSVAVVAVDLCLVAADFTEAVRQQVAEQTGLAPSAIMLAASHTHSGPDLSGQWEPPAPGSYEEARARVAHAVIQAYESMRPASLAWGRGKLAEPIVNRRDAAREVDPEIGVLRVDDDRGRLLGAIFNYACHPILVGPANREFTADYPGYAAAVVERAYDDEAVCLFLNGAAGNINPGAFPYAPDRNISALARACSLAGQPVTFRSHAAARRFGNALGGEVLRTLELIETSADVTVATRQQHIRVPLKQPAELDRFVQQWGVQPWVRDTYTGHVDCQLDLHALRIGEGVLVGVPGEPFVELGLGLKRSFPHAPVFMVGYANAYPGYIPTVSDYAENRYETVATPLSAAAPLLIAEAVHGLAREVSVRDSVDIPHSSVS